MLLGGWFLACGDDGGTVTPDPPEPPNQAPQAVASVPAQTLVEGDTATLDVASHFRDPDGDPLTYAAATSDAGVASASVAGSVVTLRAVAAGMATVTVTARDPGGLSAEQTVGVTVDPANQAPQGVGSIAGREMGVGQYAAIDVSSFFTDPDGDSLVYGAESSDAAVALASVAGEIIVVSGVAPGTVTVTVTARDPGGLEATQMVGAAVEEGGNRTPQVSRVIPDQTSHVAVATGVDLSSYFWDPDGDSLSFSAKLARGDAARISVAGGELTISGVVLGTVTIQVTSTDPGNLTSMQEFSAMVTPSPPVTVGSIPYDTLEVGDTATVDLSGYFNDPDGDSLTYAATVFFERVAGVSMSGSTMTVAALAGGNTSITATATDPGGLKATQRTRVTVVLPNEAPVATGTIPDQTVAAGGTRSVYLRSYFDDRDQLSYTAETSDANVATVSVTGSRVEVTGVARGTATVTVTARDPGGLAATQSFSVTVPNNPPEVVGAIPRDTVNVEDTITVDLSGYFEDPDGDPLSYSAEPFFADVLNATVSGSVLTIVGLQGGWSTSVTVTASDPEGLEATQRPRFTVVQPNRPPVATGPIPDDTVAAGRTLRVFMFSHFDDPDRDRLAYTATSSDEGVATVTASSSSLQIEGVARGTTQISVTARDPGGLEAGQSFQVTVPNSAPEAVGDIPRDSVNVGETTTAVDLSDYFVDPDGDALSYSAVPFFDRVEITISGSLMTMRGLEEGRTSVTVTARDPEGLEDSQRTYVTVIQPNRAPEVKSTIPDQEVDRGDTDRLSMFLYFEDPDRDDLTYLTESSDPMVVGVSVSGRSVHLTGEAKGTARVTIVARDPEGLEARQSFGVTVPNSAPEEVGEIPEETIDVGETYSVDLFSYFTDPDGDPLTYEVDVFFDRRARATVSGSVMTVEGLEDGSTSLTITARDPDGGKADQRTRVTVIQPNRPPVAKGTIDDLTMRPGQSRFILAFAYFEDPDRDQLTYTATSSNTSVATASVTGSRVDIEGVGAGSAIVTVTATDPDGLSARHEVGVTVEQDNQGPRAVGIIPEQTLDPGNTATVDVASSFRDPDGDALSYVASTSNSSVATASVAGSRVTITAVSRGRATITVTASDPDGLSARQRIRVNVASRAPQGMAIPGQVIASGGTAQVDLSSYFTDPDGDRLSYSGSSNDRNVATASVVGDRLTIRAAGAGSTTITVTATDPDRLTATQDVAVTVQAQANRQPTARSIPAQGVTAGRAVNLDLSSYFSDPDGDALTYGGSSANAGVATTGVIGSTLTIRGVAAGSTVVTATAEDAGGLQASRDITVTVAAPDNRPPEATGTIPDRTLDADESATVRLASYFDDPDGDALTYTATVSPARVTGATISGSTVTVTGSASGTATVTITARDPGGLTATQTFDVTVTNSAPAEVGTIPATPVAVGATATIDASSYFSDRDGDQLSYTAESSVPGVASASVASSTVSITGVAVGTAVVTVTARDPGGLEARQTASVTVRATNRTPEAQGTIPRQTLEAGASNNVDVTSYFRDPDDDPLDYSVATSNASVATASVLGSMVTLSGVSPGTATVTVTAADPSGASATQEIGITIEQGNRPPQPSGTVPAQSVDAGAAVTVDVASYFSDPDGDQLSYAATSSNTSVATVSRQGSRMTITGAAPGTATVTVTASDTDGESATQDIAVTVTGQQDNRAPETLAEIPVHFLEAGESTPIDLSSFFTDPDDDALTYSTAFTTSGVARALASGDELTLTGAARGTTTLTVTATDPGGLAVELFFTVAVATANIGSFDLDLIAITPMSESHAAAFRNAAEKWMAVLADTELPDMPVSADIPTGCWDLTSDRRVDTVDDLLLVVSVRHIDGSGGTLASAGSCRSRDDSLLPWMGMIEFDEADLNVIAENGGVEEVVRHEMAHTLGFNRFHWGRMDLIANPTLTWLLFGWLHSPGEDAHFTGPLARAAFNEAGGSSYTDGGKVPLENCLGSGSGDSHWRERYWSDALHDSGCREGEVLLGGELMSPIYTLGQSSPLSRITLQALADMGYTVDLDEAETYSLPTAGQMVRFDPKRMIHYGDDVAKGPVTLYDRAGRPVRIIPN
ncbi:MAG: Ig-like domain-containing protein [bacterium]|nr:Ig-like domain-containing protein [bacterium]